MLDRFGFVDIQFFKPVHFNSVHLLSNDIQFDVDINII